jgi:Flp pilus assembly protein TadG
MRHIRRFAADQQGNVAIIVALLILPMLLIAGGATDLARYEAHRAQLQDGVDRAVLAAASLSQNQTAQSTVDEFLKTLPFIADVALDVKTTDTINSKSVRVSADYSMPTAFLPLIGIHAMAINATGAAEERRSNVELSLMLDFSGSMEGAKYSTIKVAATDFINAMVTPESKPYTTINMVPYAGQVSLGKDYFNAWGGKRVHNNSSCFELVKTDFYSAELNLASRNQAPHFTVWNSTSQKPKMPANMFPGWCPSDDTAITLMSNDAQALVSRIAGYKMYDGTGTAIAMTWGLRFLDPAMRPRVQQAVTAGRILPAFKERPSEFRDPETVKVMVLMTDGAITEQYTAVNPNADVRQNNNAKIFYDPVWKKNLGTDQTQELLQNVCARAKELGVVVFTIGFQLSDNNASQLKMKNDLRRCATSLANYYDVQGLDIAAAFRSIASTLQRIKLTQ